MVIRDWLVVTRNWGLGIKEEIKKLLQTNDKLLMALDSGKRSFAF